MVATRTIDEIIDFIASAPTPAQIIRFKPSNKLQFRVNYLLEKQRELGLNEEEKREVEQYLLLEHIMRLAKMRAKMRLAA